MGAIQTGLFLPRAQEANMPRTVLVRRPNQAQQITSASKILVNVALIDRLSTLEVNDIDSVTLNDPRCVELLTAATEIALGVPSTINYTELAPMMAEATRRKSANLGPKCLIYACQNEPSAAATLTKALINSGGCTNSFDAIDMVIGKMSRTIRDQREIQQLGLVKGTKGLPESWLVEHYDDILISAPRRGFTRTLPRLTEISDLQPYEIAKLNGHNAAHSTLAYAGQLMNYEYISEVMACEAVQELVLSAFIRETGAYLQKHFSDRDTLFTTVGWQQHAKDLFSRMANPWLGDDCQRVGRNPERKLGWNDRLVGTIRLIEDSECSAKHWRMALHCATESSKMSTEMLSKLWKLEGASETEIEAMHCGQSDILLQYQAWRKKLYKHNKS